MSDSSQIENDGSQNENPSVMERAVRALEAIAGALMVIAEHYDQGEEEQDKKGIKTLSDGVVG